LFGCNRPPKSVVRSSKYIVAAVTSGAAEAASALRSRLELEKEAYKEEVGTLRALKQTIESVQVRRITICIYAV